MATTLEKKGKPHTIMEHLSCLGPTSATEDVPLGKECIRTRQTLDKTTHRMLISLLRKQQRSLHVGP